MRRKKSRTRGVSAELCRAKGKGGFALALLGHGSRLDPRRWTPSPLVVEP